MKICLGAKHARGEQISAASASCEFEKVSKRNSGPKSWRSWSPLRKSLILLLATCQGTYSLLAILAFDHRLCRNMPTSVQKKAFSRFQHEPSSNIIVPAIQAFDHLPLVRSSPSYDKIIAEWYALNKVSLECLLSFRVFIPALQEVGTSSKWFALSACQHPI